MYATGANAKLARSLHVLHVDLHASTVATGRST